MAVDMRTASEGRTVLTLARKLDVVQRKTVTIRRPIPNVRLATPPRPNLALGPSAAFPFVMLPLVDLVGESACMLESERRPCWCRAATSGAISAGIKGSPAIVT